MDDLWHVIRLVNVPLFTSALLGNLVRLNDMWASLNLGHRLMAGGFNLMLLTGGVANGYRYFTGVAADPLVLGGTFSCLLICAGLWWLFRDAAA